MSLLIIVLAFILLFVILDRISATPKTKNIIYIIMAVVVAIWICNATGLMTGLHVPVFQTHVVN